MDGEVRVLRARKRSQGEPACEVKWGSFMDISVCGESTLLPSSLELFVRHTLLQSIREPSTLHSSLAVVVNGGFDLKRMLQCNISPILLPNQSTDYGPLLLP